MVMQAFIDEAGNRKANPYFVMAGLIGEASSWAEFSDEWHALLCEPPAIPTFKMSRAHRWPESRVRKFVSAIDRHGFLSFHCIVDFAAFDRVFGGVKSAGFIFRDAYTLAYMMILLGA
jgi:hypothetical protein